MDKTYEQLDSFDKLKVYLDYGIVISALNHAEGYDFNMMTFEKFSEYNFHQRRSEGQRWLDAFRPRIFGTAKHEDYHKGILQAKPTTYTYIHQA